MAEDNLGSSFVTPPGQEGQPYFRTPALSPDGKQLAFIYASDIWLAAADGGAAERLTAHPAAHFTPRFSPDGTLLAFSSDRVGAGDIYTLPLAGGAITRLTYHDTFSSVEDWSADGRHIYITSNREGMGQAIYLVGPKMAMPVPIYGEPYEQLDHVSVSPDGTQLAFNTVRSSWWRRGPNPFAPCDIWIGPSLPDPAALRKFAGAGSVDGNAALRWSYAGLNRWPLWSPDGSGIYFVSDHSGAENIWCLPYEDDEARQITHFSDGRVLWPTIARRAEVIVFERDWQIWRLDLRSGVAEPIAIRVRADTKMTPVRIESWSRGFSELSLAPDGKKVGFVARGEVFADFADKETDREQRQGPSFRVTNTQARESEITWTPDSRSLIYISDRHGEDELYRYDFLTRTETRLTNDLSPKTQPRCSPDGNWAAYFRGHNAIDLLNLKTGEARLFAEGHFVWAGALAWSPDSCWLAYLVTDDRAFSNVYIQHIDEPSARQITFLSNLTGSDLLWSPDGRFLVFTSGHYRSESQVVRVDLRPPPPLFREAEFEKLFEEKREKRSENGEPESQELETLPQDAKDYNQAAATENQEAGNGKTQSTAKKQHPDGETESETANNSDDPEPKPKTPNPKALKVEIVFEGIERRLRFLTPIQMDARVQSINPCSRDLLFLAMVAGRVNIWSLPLDEPRQDQPPRQLTANASSKSDVQFTPDGKAFFYLEDGQIVIRKFPNGNEPTILQTRGDVIVDFNQEKQQVFHEAWRLLRDTFYDQTFRGLDWNSIRAQFAPLAAGVQTPRELRIILNMMAGELRASHLGASYYSVWSNSDGYTGLLFDPAEQLAHGHLRIAALLPDSPVALLADPPHVGEYLIAVNGTPLGEGITLDHLLHRAIGRRVQLQVAATPDGANARELAIRPIDSASYSSLRYRAWVATNEAYVHQISEGRLGYVHIREMSYGAYQQFLADLDAETYSKAGVVLDVRYNSGGHIATFIVDVLTRRNLLSRGFRDQLATDAYHFSGSRALNKPTVLVVNEHSASNAEIFTEIYRRLGLGTIVGRPTAGAVIGTVSTRLLDWTIFRLPRFYVTTPEGEDLEGAGRAVDMDVEQPLGARAQGRDHQLDAAVATLLAVLNDKDTPESNS
ncbi:MAG: S41 family peptidase [Chloroflexales bacterium]|nr:S41 family peptidase [Chloroflexales bacterium]